MFDKHRFPSLAEIDIHRRQLSLSEDVPLPRDRRGEFSFFSEDD
jgi:hypothetical protein